MAVTMPGVDRLPHGPLRDLVGALHELYRTVGKPGVRVISTLIRDRQDLPDTVSHETISGMLRGDGLPRWVKLECVVRVLASRSVDRPDPDDEVRRFLALWLEASDAPPQPRSDHLRGRAGDFVVPTGDPDRPLTSSPQLPRIVGNLPVQNIDFTGRDLLLDAIRNGLTTPTTFPVVLHGLGGTGKTQVAVEYVYRWAAEYELIWWIPAEDPLVARASLAALGERLELPPNQDIQQTVRAVLSELERGRMRWLLVFDNAELSEGLHSLLPTVGGHTLLTSRDPGWSSVGTALDVEPFDRAESIQFLRRRGQNISGADADRLAEKLGDLPLALEQVAAAQSATGMPLAEYLKLFDEHVQELLSAGRPKHYPTTVVAFVNIAVERLRAESPTAAHVLELFAYLGAEPVSVTLLRSGRDGPVSAPLGRALRDPIQMGRAIRALRRYGLAKIDPADQRIEVHRLVQVALREMLDGPARERGLTNLHNLLAAANPGTPDDVRTWALHAEIAPHVLPADLINSVHLDARRVVPDQIRYLNRNGDYEGSRRLGELAVTAWRRAPDEGGLGPDHELTLLATREWAEPLRSLGQYEQCRQLSVDTWTRLQRNPLYGADHPYTLSVAVSVGAHHRINGDYPAALDVDRDTLERHKARYGDDDPRTLHVMNNLAVNMRLLGDFWAAYQMDEEVVRKRRALLGDQDSRTLLSISNLARDHYGLGHYAEALRLQQESLPTFRTQVGARHGHVLLAARTVAIALRKNGHFAEAFSLARENQDSYHELFGADHEHTLTAIMSYANASFANALRLGRLPTEAKELATLAVARYRRRFGERNPLTMAAEINQAIILRALGERREARQMDAMTLDELRQVLGEDHPYTLCAATNFATDLSLNREYDAARAMLERTLAGSVRVRGDEHPDTLACSVNLALDLRLAGDQDGAQARLDTTLGTMRRVLGPNHPDTLNAARGTRAECDIEPPPT